MKKFLLFLYIFPCFIMCGCHPFAHNKNPNSQNNFSSKRSSSTRSSMESVQKEAGTSTQPNKAVSSINPDTLPNKKMAWWIKREENHMTPSAQEEVDLSRYDAWYVKTNLKGAEKPVFLTFDCGYENGYTASILDVLKKHKAPGAFFLCRHYIEDQPELVKRMKKEGHIVGNHTVHHKSMPTLSDRDNKQEIIDCAQYCKEATGYDMDPFIRPPMGEYNERTLSLTKKMGYRTIFWSMAYVDFKVDQQPGKDYVIEHFQKYTHKGAIPLIHNISRSNAEALETVIINLKKEGYRFEGLKKLPDY